MGGNDRTVLRSSDPYQMVRGLARFPAVELDLDPAKIRSTIADPRYDRFFDRSYYRWCVAAAHLELVSERSRF